MKPPKHSRAAIKSHQAPVRANFKTGKAYAEACRLVSEARTEFDKSAKSAKAKVSTKPKQSTVVRSGSSKNEQKPKKAAKPLTAAQKLDAVGEEVIFEQVAEGIFYEDIAKLVGVSRHALMNWMGAREDMYAHAREARADKLAEEIITISDDSSRDTYIDKEGVERTDNEVVSRSRLRVDSRKWLASKMLPKKYGDRLNLDADVRVVDLTDEQVNAKLAELAAKARSRQDCNGTDA